MTKEKSTAGKRFQKEVTKKKPRKYTLHLYIAGLSPRSQNAIANLKKLCEDHLPGQYKLAVHDIYKNPNLAKNGQILAAPTLVKELPLPLRKFVGDLSNIERLLIGLDLRSNQ